MIINTEPRPNLWALNIVGFSDISLESTLCTNFEVKSDLTVASVLLCEDNIHKASSRRIINSIEMFRGITENTLHVWRSTIHPILTYLLIFCSLVVENWKKRNLYEHTFQFILSSEFSSLSIYTIEIIFWSNLTRYRLRFRVDRKRNVLNLLRVIINRLIMMNGERSKGKLIQRSQRDRKRCRLEMDIYHRWLLFVSRRNPVMQHFLKIRLINQDILMTQFGFLHQMIWVNDMKQFCFPSSSISKSNQLPLTIR